MVVHWIFGRAIFIISRLLCREFVQQVLIICRLQFVDSWGQSTYDAAPKARTHAASEVDAKRNRKYHKYFLFKKKDPSRRVCLFGRLRAASPKGGVVWRRRSACLSVSSLIQSPGAGAVPQAA